MTSSCIACHLHLHKHAQMYSIASNTTLNVLFITLGDYFILSVLQEQEERELVSLVSTPWGTIFLTVLKNKTKIT